MNELINGNAGYTYIVLLVFIPCVQMFKKHFTHCIEYQPDSTCLQYSCPVCMQTCKYNIEVTSIITHYSLSVDLREVIYIYIFNNCAVTYPMLRYRANIAFSLCPSFQKCNLYHHLKVQTIRWKLNQIYTDCKLRIQDSTHQL